MRVVAKQSSTAALRQGALATVVVLALALGAPLQGTAEMFRYRDEAGRMFVVDSLHKVPPAYRDQVDGGEPEPKGAINTGVSTWDPETAAQAERARSKAYPGGPRVSVFVTSWCGYCRKLERFLDEKQIRYRSYDVDEDSAARERWKALAPGGGVPVTEVGSKVIRGYKPKALLAALRR